MKNIEEFVDAGNIKFRTKHRESIYYVLRDDDMTGLFSSISDTFYTAFAIGYHFESKEEIAPKSINHVNLVSFDRGVKELMVQLILKREPNIDDPKELWKQVEMYAEYGIQVLFNNWKKNYKMLEIEDIIESPIDCES